MSEKPDDELPVKEGFHGFPDRDAIEIHRAIIKRMSELTLEQLDRDLEALNDKNPLDSLITRAKWQKQADLVMESWRLFERRYGSPRGGFQLALELYGDQLGMSPLIEAQDIERRLVWYMKRIGKEFERTVNQRISTYSIKSPIEQLFLMEWIYQDVETRLGVKLEPQLQLDLDGEPYYVDFFVTKDPHTLKLAVELDGHDFHEKTPTQVAKDKARERAMLRQNIFVVRFSGTKLVRNPRKCVQEVAKIVENQLQL